MEVSLVQKKSVTLTNRPKAKFTTLTKKKGFKVDARYWEFHPLFVTPDMLQVIRACDIHTDLVVNQLIHLPRVWLGLASPTGDTQVDLDEFYILITGSDLFERAVFGINSPFEVSYRVDFAPLSYKKYQLKPEFSSQFITSRRGARVEYANQVKMSSKDSPSQIYDVWKNSNVDSEWKSVVSVTAFLKPAERNLSGVLWATRRMLTEELLSDAVIVADNGNEIKCHRGILAAQSSFFAEMFQTDMLEGRTGRVKLPGLTEECIRAFLQFMYNRDIQAPKESSIVCLQLLKVGHKYEIPDLKQEMRQILLETEDSGYNAEVAFEMYLFSKEAGIAKLKAKAMKTLKKKYKELKDLPLYKDMFLKNLDTTAMELVDFFATAQCCDKQCECKPMIVD